MIFSWQYDILLWPGEVGWLEWGLRYGDVVGGTFGMETSFPNTCQNNRQLDT